MILQVGRAVHIELDSLLDRAGDFLQQLLGPFADSLCLRHSLAVRRGNAFRGRNAFRGSRGLLLVLGRARAPVRPVLHVEVFLVAVFGLERPARRRVAGDADDPAEEPVVLPVRVLVRAGDDRTRLERHARRRACELHPVVADADDGERSGVRLEVGVVGHIAAEHDGVVLVDRLELVRDHDAVLDLELVAKRSVDIPRLRRHRELADARVVVGDFDGIRLVGLAPLVAEAPHDGRDVGVVCVARRREVDRQRRTVRVNHAERGGCSERRRGLRHELDLRHVARGERHGCVRGIVSSVRRDVGDGILARLDARGLPCAVRRDVDLEEAAVLLVEAHLAALDSAALPGRHRAKRARGLAEREVEATFARRRRDDEVRGELPLERLVGLREHRVLAVVEPREAVRAEAVRPDGLARHVARAPEERDVAVLDDGAVVAHHIARDDSRRNRRRLVAVDVGLPRDRDGVSRRQRVALVGDERVDAVLQLIEREVAVVVGRHHARERLRPGSLQRQLERGVCERLARAAVEEVPRDRRRHLALLDKAREAAYRVAVELQLSAQVQARGGVRHLVGRVPRVKLEPVAADRLELERQPPRVAGLEDARRIRRAEADDQHALLREVVVVVVIRAEDRVRVAVRVVDDEGRRVHLRVALVLVHDVARVDAVVARTLRQFQLRFEDGAKRLLVDVHRVAERLAVRRDVVVAVRRDVVDVEDSVHVRGVYDRHALGLDAAETDVARRRQPRAREREAHVAHVRRDLGIDRPQLRGQRLHRHVDRLRRNAGVLERKIHLIANRMRRHNQHNRAVRAHERRRVVHHRRRHVPRRDSGHHW